MSTRASAKRLVLTLSAAAVIGATLMPAPGTASVAEGKKKEPAFAGYSVTSTATPQKFEIYEPTIPLPAVPQAELSFSYTAVTADTASSKARASYLWPGGPVGEGFKTIVEQLGLPPELAGPLAENGYPVQVNADFPGGPKADSDEPLPGTVQRAEAGKGSARADNGTSTDGNVDAGDDGGDGGGDSPLPPLPGLPQIPGIDTDLLESLLGGGGNAVPATAAPDPAPSLPPELTALVDLGGYTSTSATKNEVGKVAYSRSRSAASDISLLGGLVTIEGVTTTASATSDGKKGVPVGETVYGDITAFGQKFKYGTNGYEAAGSPLPIPGLPDDAAAALEQIGLKISTPEPVYTQGDKDNPDAASVSMPGLVLDFDLTVLRKQLGPVTDALNEIIGQIPAEAGQLKSALQAAANLSPRVVVYLGSSFASVDTSEAIEVPPVVVPDPPEAEDPPAGNGNTGTPPNSGPPAGPTDSSPLPSGPIDEAAPIEDLDPQLVQQDLPGLPGVFSIPGLLLYGGLLGGAALGFFVRRLGLLALGQAGSCPHGLDSGLPDLRKVT